MKRKELRSIVVFYDSDLTSPASRDPGSGWSLYKAVLVRWDQDDDERALTLIDELPPHMRSQLLVVQERKAMVGFLWKDEVPSGYDEGEQIEVEGDVWTVDISKACGPA